jgi:rRNA maturation protein Nop10
LVYLIKKCGTCGRYTLQQDKCPVCGNKVYAVHPAKFSIDDKYWKYRYALKKEGSGK